MPATSWRKSGSTSCIRSSVQRCAGPVMLMAATTTLPVPKTGMASPMAPGIVSPSLTLPYSKEAAVAGVLAGKTALVTGAARGIGKGIALALAGEDAQLVLVDSDRSLLDDALSEVVARGAVAIAAPADVANPDEVTDSVGPAAERFDGVDVLVNS